MASKKGTRRVRAAKVAAILMLSLAVGATPGTGRMAYAASENGISNESIQVI